MVADAQTPKTALLRAAREDDAAAIAAIYATHVLNGVATFEETPPDADEIGSRLRKIAAGGFPYLVVELDGGVAGFAYASAWNDRSAYRFTVQDSIYIDDALRRRGLGKLLLGALIELCRTRGASQMMAGIGGASPPSIALHTALGFREIGRASGIGYKFGRWLDVVYMQRSL